MAQEEEEVAVHRSKALAFVVSQIRHVCPYKGQDVPLALCYKRVNDIEDTFCFGCGYVPALKRKYGLRTFRRKLIQSRCAVCAEPASLHEDEAPYRGVRTNCAGFTPEREEGKLWVALDTACTKWMTVDTATGLRELAPGDLLGAPDAVPSDERDTLRTEAAEAAERRRLGQERGNTKLKMKDEP